jgi:signal transduction histidine kinase/DNA-binding NarL/FixJ family response regulator
MESMQLVIIEDHEPHFELMKRAIAKEFPSVRIHHFPDAGTCLEHLDDLNPDIIVADYLMPGMNGIEFLEALKRDSLDIPVIMLTGQGNESVAVQAMKLGAWDYLVKSADIFKLLPGAVGKVVRERKLRDSLRESARLNDLLLNNFPHPAILVRKDRKVVAANHIAQEFGARINDPCWHGLGHGEYLSEDHKRFLKEHPGSDPPAHIQCTFCLTDQAFAAGRPTNIPELKALDRVWDTWWVPIDDEICLHYAIDITAHKCVEERIHRLTQKLIKAQEVERQRLAYDLHDSIGQELSTIKIGLDTLTDLPVDVPSLVAGRVSQLSKTLQGTIEALRNLAYDLRPAFLDQLGLVEALQEYCDEYSKRQGIAVEFVTAGVAGLRLDPDTRITLYRLVQEGLNNVKKHAAASKVTIRLVSSFPSIILRIEDNGHGFDVTERMNAGHNGRCMGLQGMQERVALLGGTIRIESRPMEGTRIRIEVPLEEDPHGAKEDRLDCR